MPRRGENIYKRKDGRWEGRYTKSAVNGKVQYGYVYAKTYRDVKRKLSSFSEKTPSTAEKIQDISSDTFGVIASEWLSVISPQLKQSSVVRYANIVNIHLLPCFAHRPISSITKDDVSLFCSDLLAGNNADKPLAPKTVTSVISVLKSIFEYASEVKKYHVVNLNGISIKQPQGNLRILSAVEQKKLSEYLFQNLTLSNLGILLCLYTGLRIGEICALKWEDISFTERTLYVRQTMQRIQVSDNNTRKTEILISAPKSKCSVRKIPIPDRLLDFMFGYKQPASAYFLTGLPDKYIEPRTMQNRFKRVIKSCGIENANFHALRHTFATRCVELGFDLKSLSEILGHANVNITLNRYVHPSMELKQQNMDRLSELLAVK